VKRRLKGELLIVGDEVIRKAEDPLKVNLEDAVDILMLKVAPLGGIKKSLDIATHHKLPVVVSSALESAIGISHGLRLAAALPNLEYASGLATGSLFKTDIAAHEIINGEIKLGEVEPNLDSLERFAASKERLEWWRERVKSCWEVAA
ncbi:MAG: enolase C-terminal domain-like protein, partial [Actinomycetota bacterium]